MVSRPSWEPLPVDGSGVLPSASADPSEEPEPSSSSSESSESSSSSSPESESEAEESESLLREPSAREFEPSESSSAEESARSFEPESFEATLSDEVSLSSEVSPRAAEPESELLFESEPLPESLSAREPSALLLAELVESLSESDSAVSPAVWESLADPSGSSVLESASPDVSLFALSSRSGYFSPSAMMVSPSDVKVHPGRGPLSGKFSNSIGFCSFAAMIVPSEPNLNLLGAAAVSVASATD